MTNRRTAVLLTTTGLLIEAGVLAFLGAPGAFSRDFVFAAVVIPIMLVAVGAMLAMQADGAGEIDRRSFVPSLVVGSLVLVSVLGPIMLVERTATEALEAATAAAEAAAEAEAEVLRLETEAGLAEADTTAAPLP